MGSKEIEAANKEVEAGMGSKASEADNKEVEKLKKVIENGNDIRHRK